MTDDVMSATLYERVQMPGTPGGLAFVPGGPAGSLVLTRPGGSYHFDPYVSPPPPPGSFWLPAPGAPWASTPAFRQDFTTVSTLPSGDWDYAGAPGGTSNCEWLSTQVSLVTGKGVLIKTQWDAALNAWITGAFGTPTEFTCPIVVRWYDQVVTAFIVGHNKIQLFWAGQWIEVDVDEASISMVGAWDVSWARTHLNSNANHSDPIPYLQPQALGAVVCNEARMTDNGDGTGTLAIYRNGVLQGQAQIDSTMWAALLSEKHWIGTQDELYSIGSGDKSQVDERYVLGIEVYEPA